MLAAHHRHIYIYTHMYIYTYIHMCTYTHMYILYEICIYIYIYVSIETSCGRSSQRPRLFWRKADLEMTVASWPPELLSSRSLDSVGLRAGHKHGPKYSTYAYMYTYIYIYGYGYLYVHVNIYI